jgi:hypothetical protein
MLSPAAFQLFLTLLVSLFPLALYCFILAGVNRRDRPLLLRGTWDFVGVLFALSGMLLWAGPLLLTNLGQRTLVDNLAGEAPRSFDDLWSRWWLLWACYYGFVVAGAVFLLILRGSITAIYNVDVEQLPQLLLQAVQHLGFDVAQNQQNQILIAPAKSLAPAGEGPPTFCAAVDIDPSPGMCHATLRWYTDEPKVRAEIEQELSRQLSAARPLDNPAGAWLLTVSTVLFGAMLFWVIFFIVVGMMPRRW